MEMGQSHFPHGKCGLKYEIKPCRDMGRTSLPSREVWFEIILIFHFILINSSLPSREVWVEISSGLIKSTISGRSLPSREVWVEMAYLL